MTHEEIEEMLGAYALDAVSPAEREEIENHLAECPRCQQEVAAHLQVAGVLGSLGGTAPVGLWDKIAGALSIESGDAGESPPPIAPVIGLDSGRVRREAARGSEGKRRRSSVVAVVSVAAALLVVVGVLAATIVRLDNRVSNLETAMVKGGVASQVRIAEAQAGSRTIALAATSGPWSAKLVLDQGQAFLVPSKMPSIAPSETFQAWAVVGGKYVSLGVLGNRPGDVQLVLQPRMSEVAINEEPEGGTPQPTNPVILAAAV
ncbi:MAG TPA: anti-sigma factor [Acidimicrobiales bacterium]|jgi:anti-sigma factor RsiW|nr:anti-sigma factor [Acidimicrobiales bacterium]